MALNVDNIYFAEQLFRVRVCRKGHFCRPFANVPPTGYEPGTMPGTDSFLIAIASPLVHGIVFRASWITTSGAEIMPMARKELHVEGQCLM